MTIDIATLHEPGYPPLPFLYEDENARLRLVFHTFTTYGNDTVARIAERILQHQFHEPEVIFHMLYNGLLDSADTYPASFHEPHPGHRLGDSAAKAMRHSQALRAIIVQVAQRMDLSERTTAYIFRERGTIRKGLVVLPPHIVAVLPLLRGFVLRLEPTRVGDNVPALRITARNRYLFRPEGARAGNDDITIDFTLGLDTRNHRPLS
ncbi:hypothetical protein B0H12DRAFT_1239596 [Mycena haematopus]|nr:hypothetical protein B0H12DRAFT_1239596 [Mycena haematopus]